MTTLGQESEKINPFAADEDDDSDPDDQDFTVGDLEAREEGKGYLPPASGLQGNEETVDHLLQDATIVAKDKTSTVGTTFSPPPPVPSSSTSSTTLGWGGSRAIIPSLWPFGNNSLSSASDFSSKSHHSPTKNSFGQNGGGNGADGVVRSQDSSEDNTDSDDDGEGLGEEGRKRRLSSTTEATRRTSIEDEDEEDGEDVVHVKMDVTGLGMKGEDDGELVEIGHEEMQGVETRDVSK